MSNLVEMSGLEDQSTEDKVDEIVKKAQELQKRYKEESLSDEELEDILNLGKDRFNSQEEQENAYNRFSQTYMSRNYSQLTTDEQTFIAVMEEASHQLKVSPEDIGKKIENDVTRDIENEEKAASNQEKDENLDVRSNQEQEPRVVPDLAQSVLQQGFSNPGIEQNLRSIMIGMEDGHAKDMFNKVLEAYTSQDAAKVVALNDLLANEEDVAIAKNITSALGYGEDDYPEMIKNVAANMASQDKGVLNVGVIDENNNSNTNPGPDDDKQKMSGGFGIGGIGGDDDEEQIEEYFARLRTPSSDINDANIDLLSYDVLKSMGKIKQELTDEQLRDENLVYNVVKSTISSLSDKESEQFNVALVDAIVDGQKLGVVPPTVLTQAYKVYGEQIDKAQDEDVKNQFMNKRELVAAQIDNLTDQYYTGVRNITRDNFNFDDNTNIADVYDGYKEMIETRRPDVDETQQQKIDAVSEKLDKDIGEYDSYWGIDGITKYNIGKVRENHAALTKKMAGVTLDDETMQFASNIRFNDENGTPIPQFIDPETKAESLTWQQGYEIKPGSELQTMVDLARNNTIIENLSIDAQSSSVEDLQSDMAERVKLQAFAWATAEDTVKGALEEHDRFTNPQYLEEFKTRMMDPSRPLNISKQGFDAAVRLSVNDTMGAINRISKVSGPKDDMLKRIHQPIAKYDPRASTRFGDGGEFKVNWLKTAAWTFAASLGQKLVTYGATLGAVKAASALGLTSTAPAAVFKAALPTVTAVTCMTMAGVGMYMNYQNYKKEAKAAGQKTKLKEFFTKQPYATTNIASGLGFAAGACLMTGNVPAATALGLGCLAVAGYGTYKDAKAHGLSTGKALWQAVKKGSAIAFGGAAGSYVGSLLGVTPTYQTKDQDTPGNTVKGPDSHDYSATERAHATNRLDDPRFSEFLNKFHVAHDLQDASDPNKVSVSAVDNLRAGIEQAIHATGDDKSFFTDIAGDPKSPNYVMNTDMLGYKFEQLAYLAPNPNAPVDPAFAAAHHLPAGTTIGDYLSFKAPDGTTMNYMDALREVVSTGKSSNPLGLADMLGKIENVVGGQIDDAARADGSLINDAGKVTMFGTGPAASPVQSYNADANAGYDIGSHTTTTPDIPGRTHIFGGEKLWGAGYWEPVKGMFSGLRKRAGAIADKLFGVKKTPINTSPIVDKQPIVTFPADQNSKKPYVTPEIDNRSSQLLADEYKIVYGIEPSIAAGVAYKKLVLAELQSDREAGRTKADNLIDYITERKATYDEKLATIIAPAKEDIKGFHETKDGKEATAKARQEMFQTNLSFNGEDLPRNHMTLQKFTKFVTFALSNGGDRGKVTAAHDNATGRFENDGYNERPSGGSFDVGTGKVAGQSTNNGKGTKDDLAGKKNSGRE